MAQLSFDVMDDLKESRQTFDNFIAAPDTKDVIEKAIHMMAESIQNGGMVISAGNGGSMCDAMHFAEELTGRYRLNRPSLPAVSICDPCHITCVGNDYGFDFVFSRFLEGVGKKGDVFLGRIQEVHTTIIHIFIRGLECLLTSPQMGQN